MENKTVTAQYFMGKWQQFKTVYQFKNYKTIEESSGCNLKSYWEFKRESDSLKSPLMEKTAILLLTPGLGNLMLNQTGSNTW